ncbi:hypothetical protein NDU88_005337 [Pleurodeles waltl]|uniref:Uncharacterized protein n=1 Tax=Pleurodeles waltl TaxID=8319 RepID=A0AAV7NR95_PLEWA|nr:hypothetical protein NDU88_005337 [Pleurodeles waltl]
MKNTATAASASKRTARQKRNDTPPPRLCLASKPVNYEAEQKVDGCKKRLECGDPPGADSAYTAWYQTLPGIIADREREGEHGAVACAVTAPCAVQAVAAGYPAGCRRSDSPPPFHSQEAGDGAWCLLRAARDAGAACCWRCRTLPEPLKPVSHCR